MNKQGSLTAGLEQPIGTRPLSVAGIGYSHRLHLSQRRDNGSIANDSTNEGPEKASEAAVD